MIRNAVAIALLTATIAGTFYVAAVKYRAAKNMREIPKLNYLVLSFCSLRDDVLSSYAPRGKGITDNIGAFFSGGAFQLLNAVNPHPWTSLFHYTEKAQFRKELNDFGYEVIGFANRGYTRIPPRTGRVGEEKLYESSWNAFREEILKPRPRPFVAIAHLTYLHYPYIDRTRDWEASLSDAEKKQIETYLRSPEKYPAKLPFLMVLTGDAKLAALNPKTARSYNRDANDGRWMGLVTNPDLIRDWRSSPGFELDVEILRKIYDSNARQVDLFIKEALELWGDPKLRSRTAVILMGDHGEMLMDHGELTHANALFESALKFPALIRFPGQTGGLQKISEQVQLQTIADLLVELMAGRVTGSTLPEYFREHRQDRMVLRDCANKWRGLRVKNEWKYLVRVGDGERFLFNLKDDPGELLNLAQELPQKAAEFEGEYWSNYSRFSKIPIRHCSTSVSGE